MQRIVQPFARCMHCIKHQWSLSIDMLMDWMDGANHTYPALADCALRLLSVMAKSMFARSLVRSFVIEATFKSSDNGRVTKPTKRRKFSPLSVNAARHYNQLRCGSPRATPLIIVEIRSSSKTKRPMKSPMHFYSTLFYLSLQVHRIASWHSPKYRTIKLTSLGCTSNSQIAAESRPEVVLSYLMGYGVEKSG
jgi:hypothetical protein